MLVCSNVSSVLCHLCSFKFLFFPVVWQRSAFGVLCSWCSLAWWCWLQCLISFTSSLLHGMKRCRDWIGLGRLVVVCVCERRNAVSCTLFYRVSMFISRFIHGNIMRLFYCWFCNLSPFVCTHLYSSAMFKTHMYKWDCVGGWLRTSVIVLVDMQRRKSHTTITAIVFFHYFRCCFCCFMLYALNIYTKHEYNKLCSQVLMLAVTVCPFRHYLSTLWRANMNASACAVHLRNRWVSVRWKSNLFLHIFCIIIIISRRISFFPISCIFYNSDSDASTMLIREM